jgi:acyl-coenzyme A synthetase/AMP-(fatty) acid ligase
MNSSTNGAGPPLTARAWDAVIAWRDGRPATVGDLWADALALAGRLSAERHLINVCNDRYAFLVGFVAGLACGRVSLLPGSRTAQRIAALRNAYPDSVVLTDEPERAADRGSILVPVFTGSLAQTGPMIAPASDAIVCIAFTSGTTGRPVPHAKTWGSLMAQTEAAARRFDLLGSATTSVVATVPHDHMYGFETTVLLPLRANIAIDSGTPLYPDDIRATLAAVPEPRLLITSPMHLRALGAGQRSLPALRGIISATAPLAGELAGRLETQFATEIREIYGCTEAGSVASRRTISEAAWEPYDCLRLAYSTTPDAQRSVKVYAPHAAPVALNDLIEILPDGRFCLQGRREDLVKVGGKRDSLAGLTAILLEIDGVHDGAFIMPISSDTAGAARPFAIVAAPGLGPKAILDALRQRIDPAFVPRRVIMVDSLPRDGLGKLPKARLEELLSVQGEAEADGA